MKKVRIGNRLIGEGEKCFIIAEAGVNHNGDVELARKLIDVAKEAGADAVKFQTFKAEEITTEDAKLANYQKKTGPWNSQYEMLKKLELSEDDFKELVKYANKRGIIFLSSPFDEESVNLLNRLGVPAFKIASGEITNLQLLEQVSMKGKPVLLSTGMATLGEIEEALGIIKRNVKSIVLLHCVTSYPAKVEDMNLKVIRTLEYAFNLPVGLSDHTLGITIPIATVALGAKVIEKHFTLDKNLPGPDHKASLDPYELKKLVDAIRDTEKALGDGMKKPTREEEKMKRKARRSIVARLDIPKGTKIGKNMLAAKRVGIGLEPKFMKDVVNKTARVNIKKDEPILWDKIE